MNHCVRQERLLEHPRHREWTCGALAAWLDVLAVDVLGYALMGNHFHVILRIRTDLAASWLSGLVQR